MHILTVFNIIMGFESYPLSPLSALSPLDTRGCWDSHRLRSWQHTEMYLQDEMCVALCPFYALPLPCCLVFLSDFPSDLRWFVVISQRGESYIFPLAAWRLMRFNTLRQEWLNPHQKRGLSRKYVFFQCSSSISLNSRDWYIQDTRHHHRNPVCCDRNSRMLRQNSMTHRSSQAQGKAM